MPECAYISRILNMPGLESMSKFWIWQSSAYGRVFNMRALHSILDISEVLNMPGFWIWLHKVLNMPQYGWIYLNKTWICLNMSEFTIINRFLNMVTLRVNGYLLTDRRMQNPIYYLRWSALGKLLLQKTQSQILRGLWVCVGF